MQCASSGLHQVLILTLLGLAGPVVAGDCGCRFQKAHSESTVGTCAIREDMARDCDPVWGMPPGPASKEARASFVDDGSIISEITQAAEQASSPNSDLHVPGLSRMSDAGFWSQYASEIRQRSQLDDSTRAGLFDQSLAFLASAGATSDLRQYSAGALIYVTDANLRLGRIEPDVRRQFLQTILRMRDRLTAFTGGGADPSDFEESATAKMLNGSVLEFSIRGKTVRGCFEVWSEKASVSSMVKAPWSGAKSRRCE